MGWIREASSKLGYKRQVPTDDTVVNGSFLLQMIVFRRMLDSFIKPVYIARLLVVTDMQLFPLPPA